MIQNRFPAMKKILPILTIQSFLAFGDACAGEGPPSPGKDSKVSVPRIASDYVNVYQPAGDVLPGPNVAELIAGRFYDDWVPNDHCFVRDESGRWHAFGITHPLTDVSNIHAGEHLLFHAMAPPGALKEALREGSWKDLPNAGRDLCARQFAHGGHTGIFLLDTFGNEVLLHEEAPGCFDPMPLGPRARPPLRPSQVDVSRDEGEFCVQNVYLGDYMDRVEPGSVKYLRVVEAPAKRAWVPRGPRRGIAQLALQLEAGQGDPSCLFVLSTTNPLPVLIKQGNALPGAGLGHVPCVRLAPMPRGAVRLTTFPIPCHGRLGLSLFSRSRPGVASKTRSDDTWSGAAPGSLPPRRRRTGCRSWAVGPLCTMRAAAQVDSLAIARLDPRNRAEKAATASPSATTIPTT
jgi:hypothetical protein